MAWNIHDLNFREQNVGHKAIPPSLQSIASLEDLHIGIRKKDDIERDKERKQIESGLLERDCKDDHDDLPLARAMSLKSRKLFHELNSFTML